MEFNQKLKELRQQKGLTQEELANALFVSRTAISKWESGRGYPNIESLKRLAQLFSVTVDELLSGEQLLNIAEQDNKQKENRFRDLTFGLLDISSLMLFFLPFFAQKIGGTIQEVSLLSLTAISPYLKIAYFVLITSILIFGILTLALQNYSCKFWLLAKNKISLILNILCTLLFILSLQPYAAIFLFVFLIIKVLMLIKTR
jgi:transcriptional regulator with XRE-family HTH domain